MANVFQYLEYKKFLTDVIDENKTVVGYKSKLAKAARCPQPFISQVIHSHVHLSHEHGWALAQYWNFTELETEFFLNLIHLARAGTVNLRDYYLKKLKNLREQGEDLTSRFRKRSITEESNQWQYYSNWYYACVHILLTIPGFEDPSQISKRLHVSRSFTLEVLEELRKMGLVHKEKNGWKSTENQIHLSKESPVSAINHAIWRNLASHKSLQDTKNKFQYTGIHSLSISDYQEIRSMIIEYLSKVRDKIAASPEETLVNLNIDWIEL